MMLMNVNNDAERKPKKVHPSLKALGRGSLPGQIAIEKKEYTLVKIFKHDFFAATGLYEGTHGAVVLKVGRKSEFLGIPLAWIGRWLTNRETEIYRRLLDVAGVPELKGNWDEAGLVHAYVPGHPLQRNETVDSDFFRNLQELLEELHRRGIAYVDLNKRENIIVGDDGRPYLIDFQISLYRPASRGRKSGLGRWVLQQFQKADLYHLAKHMRKHRPDLLQPEHEEMWRNATPLIRLHRWISGPFRQLRRQTLKRLGEWRRHE